MAVAKAFDFQVLISNFISASLSCLAKELQITAIANFSHSTQNQNAENSVQPTTFSLTYLDTYEKNSLS
jgi:hypothetical protein